MKIPQSVKILLNKKYFAVPIGENILLHDIQPMWDPETGYFVNFSLYVKFDKLELNIRRCKFYLKNEGLVWKMPSKSINSLIEVNIELYQRVLDALLDQKWVHVIGRQKAGRKVAPVEIKDFESIFASTT